MLSTAISSAKKKHVCSRIIKSTPHTNNTKYKISLQAIHVNIHDYNNLHLFAYMLNVCLIYTINIQLVHVQVISKLKHACL